MITVEACGRAASTVLGGEHGGNDFDEFLLCQVIRYDLIIQPRKLKLSDQQVVIASGRVGAVLNDCVPVSYTHLDVYKRQRVAAFRFRCEKGKPPLRAGRVNQVAHGPVQEALYTVLSAVDEPAEPLACNQLSLQFALLLYEWRGAAENRERKLSLIHI